jgi:predicted porin
MKKHIIALAITSAFVVTSAMADVEIGPFAIYGTAASALEMVSVTAGPTAVLSSLNINQTRLMDQTSKLGFKVKHDLSPDLAGIVQIESRFRLGNSGSTTDDTSEIGSRNSFVGISSKSVGTVRLGRYDNAYKLSTKQQAADIYNSLNDASGDVGSKQILTRLGGRQGDLVAYESPNLAGLTVLASYNFGKDQTNSISGGATANTASNKISNTLAPQAAFAVGYANGPFTAGIGYTTLSNVAWKLDGASAATAVFTAGAGHSLSATQFGGSFNMGSLTLGGIWESTASSLTGVAAAYDRKQDVVGLTLDYRQDALEVQLRVAQAYEVSGSGAALTANNGAVQTGIAAAYALNKFTKVVGSFTSLQNTANANFIASSEFSLSAGSSQNTAAIGLNVSF